VSVDGERLWAFAERVVGIPYIDGGRDKSGLDCFGLILLFAREFDINLPDYQGTTRGDAHIIIDEWSKVAIERPLSNLVPGDVLVFGNRTSGVARHLGIYLGGGRILQCTRAGVAINRLKVLERRLMFACRLRGME